MRVSIVVKNARRQLAVLVLGVLLAAPIVHAGSLFYVDLLSVHDATGRRIGNAWPTSNAVYDGVDPEVTVVEFRYGSTPVILRVKKGFVPERVSFTQPGCTGQPLIHPWDRPLPMHDLAAVAGRRRTLYLQSGEILDRTSRSSLSPEGECSDHAPRTAPFAAAEATIDLADHFVRPFKVRTRAGAEVPRGAP